jgi:hypothetical protein
VSLDKEVIAKEAEYSEAVKEASVLKWVKEAMEQRKIMIRMLGELWIHEYYSDLLIKETVTSDRRKSMARSRRATRETRTGRE